MKCRSCGAEIAANALICYKCGTATAEPRIPAAVRRGRAADAAPIAGLILLGPGAGGGGAGSGLRKPVMMSLL